MSPFSIIPHIIFEMNFSLRMCLLRAFFNNLSSIKIIKQPLAITNAKQTKQFILGCTLVIEEFIILQESCKQSCKGMHTSCKHLARSLQDLNPSCKILARFESNLQDSCKIINQSCKILASFLQDFESWLFFFH